MSLKNTFELSITLDSDRFYKLLNRAESGDDYAEYDDDANYVDHSMAHKGITVTYRNSQYKKKVRLIVSPSDMADKDGYLDTDRLLRKLEKRIDKYFKGKYKLNDFTMTGTNLFLDIDVRSKKKAASYIKVFQRIGRVKGYSQSDNNTFGEDASFWLEGNSNGIEFLVLNLAEVIGEQINELEDSPKQLKSAKDDSAGILRTEVRLMKAKAIREFTDGAIASVQIAELQKKSSDIFLKTFFQIIPFGDFYKKDRTVELIRERVADKSLRRKMLALVETIPQKKSLYLAQKTLDYRKMDAVMDKFAEIEVSPVTISKRLDIKYLKNLIKYMK